MNKIRTKVDLEEYLKADAERYNLTKPIFYYWIMGNESYYVLKYLKVLRKFEYYYNTEKKNIKYYYYNWLHNKLSISYGLMINVNTCGKGLFIPHLIGGIILNCEKMGSNCIVNSGVILGQKNSSENIPIIGDNVEFAPGSKVIGKVYIGNNVIIAPNSVVIKDVPDNCIVSGVPAVIIKYKI